jgi:hypothetical protein
VDLRGRNEGQRHGPPDSRAARLEKHARHPLLAYFYSMRGGRYSLQQVNQESGSGAGNSLPAAAAYWAALMN